MGLNPAMSIVDPHSTGRCNSCCDVNGDDDAKSTDDSGEFTPSLSSGVLLDPSFQNSSGTQSDACSNSDLNWPVFI